MMKLSRMLALLIVLLYPSSLAAQANQGGSSSDNQTIESIKKDIDSLMAERTRLVAEVAEIDQEVVFLREAANRLRLQDQESDGLIIITTVLNGNTTKLLKSTKPRSKVLTVIPEGTALRVIGFKYPYWKVEYLRFRGYISDYLVEQTEQVAEHKRLRGFKGFMTRGVVTNPSGSSSTSSRGRCCRTCRAGKACGDSCISLSKVCRSPPGCACNG